MSGETDNRDYKEKPVVDLNKDGAILTFDGKPIPEENVEIIKRLLGKWFFMNELITKLPNSAFDEGISIKLSDKLFRTLPHLLIPNKIKSSLT
ncbi:hypothetical protein YK48G_26760 [Lentilactobacillus fungorum]|uniref:Uncharacterized protein n=1 Tax=Lentilactobacillus fungorum TaxID=2201250 RepID=A0ABQ3W5E1_9LACO|nr:hypothetical protein YK48G_26760 [Lentilactobacillus fungorum]